MVYMNLVMEPN